MNQALLYVCLSHMYAGGQAYVPEGRRQPVSGGGLDPFTGGFTKLMVIILLSLMNLLPLLQLWASLWG